MAAPIVIIDALESILGIYLSDIRHRERAVFILCDNLVEMTCKTKAKQHNFSFDTSCSFHNATQAPGVSLSTRSGLGRRVQDRRITRNSMQHADAAITVDSQHCSDAILDVIRVIDKCWTNTSARQFKDWLKCALRIARLYSSQGDILKRQLFEDAMRSRNWRGQGPRTLTITQMPIEPGLRTHWRLVVIGSTPIVDSCLDELVIE